MTERERLRLPKHFAEFYPARPGDAYPIRRWYHRGDTCGVCYGALLYADVRPGAAYVRRCPRCGLIEVWDGARWVAARASRWDLDAQLRHERQRVVVEERMGLAGR